jgi:hypothetical protein
MMESVATVKRPTIGRDSRRGVTQDPFRVLISGLPCNSNQSSASTKEIYGQRNVTVTHTVYFAQDPGAEVNDLLVVTNQRTGVVSNLLVRGQSDSDTRGRLWVVDCEQVRSPR